MRRGAGWLLAAGLLAGCAAPAARAPAPPSAATAQAAADVPALLPAGGPEVPAAHLTAADIGALPALGGSHQGSIAMLGRAIPLPDGTWQVVAALVGTYPGYPPGARIMLLRREGARMTGLLELAGNALSRPARAGFPQGPVCQAVKRAEADPGMDGVLLADAGPPDRQDCVVVADAATGGWTGTEAPPALRAAAAALARLGVAVPARARLVGLDLADRRYRLTMALWLDGSPPALSGDAVARWALGWRAVLDAVLDHAATTAPPPGVAQIR